MHQACFDESPLKVESYRMAAVGNVLWLCSKTGGGTRAVLVSTLAAFMICSPE